MKLQFCHQIANFQADSKKDPEAIEFRDRKRETLIELIDILDDSSAEEVLLNDKILQASMNMIEVNIFRTFSNKSKFKSNFP